jgi:dihydroflavonol-4-reductase
MTILVTGATGFVGAAVARALLDRGETVRLIARKGSDRRNLDGLDAETVEGDLLDPASLRAAVRGCSGIFHVAADYRLWAPDPRPMFAANVDGTVNLFRAAAEAGAGRMVYTSSVAVLGLHPDGTPSTEETPSTRDDMIGPYKLSKFDAEKAVDRLVADEGMDIVIVNPSTPIGPRDVKPTPTGRVIVEAAAGRMPAFVDTGLNVVHVDDVAAGHIAARDRGEAGRRYILGGENLSLAEILACVAALRGRRAPKVKLPHGLILPFAWCAEQVARVTGREPFATVDGINMARKKMWFASQRAAAELGYTHRPAAEAIADAVDWFDKNGYLT